MNVKPPALPGDIYLLLRKRGYRRRFRRTGSTSRAHKEKAQMNVTCADSEPDGSGDDFFDRLRAMIAEKKGKRTYTYSNDDYRAHTNILTSQKLANGAHISYDDPLYKVYRCKIAAHMRDLLFDLFGKETGYKIKG